MKISESLLYSGYQALNLTTYSSIGAITDLSVDICSPVYEVVKKSGYFQERSNTFQEALLVVILQLPTS